MSDYFFGEIRVFAHHAIPRGWVEAKGQLLPVAQNQVLFSLLGNRYGGDGRVNFALPDLRGRVPIGFRSDPTSGPAYPLGSAGGSETVALTESTLPPHQHVFAACKAPGTKQNTEKGFHLAAVSPDNDAKKTRFLYGHHPGAGKTVALHADTIEANAGGQNHNNMQPFTVLTYCISTTGLWPTRG